MHYPKLFGKSNAENEEIYNNSIYNFNKLKALKHPIKYEFDDSNEATCNIPDSFKVSKNVNILDVGCGYGGLMFGMSEKLENDDLALGMEIRDKVSNFVSDKIKSLRRNSHHLKV